VNNSQVITQNYISSPAELSASPPANQIGREYEALQERFQAQSAQIKGYLESQARLLSEAIVGKAISVRFSLPENIVDNPTVLPGEAASYTIPPKNRNQSVGGIIGRLTNRDIHTLIRYRLLKLECSTDPVVSISASLIRFATALDLVHRVLPSGNPVRYRSEEWDELPSIPVENNDENRVTPDPENIPSARGFYLPQWTAFDQQGHLLVNSLKEAYSVIDMMQRFVEIMEIAIDLAPYIVNDEQFQQKRYGISGQVIYQGRALGRYATQEIIRIIHDRVAANNLNRGLSLTLPYFDDQELRLKRLDFDVIPPGRVLFTPAFVVLAIRKQREKVTQKIQLNDSTRKHLLDQLQILEQAMNTIEVN
jgi:hypothetical protein